MTTATTAFATRFDTRDTEEGTEFRLFAKRVLLGKFDVEEIVLEDWEDKLPEFIASEGRSFDAVQEFLTTEAEEEEIEEGDDEEREPHSIVPAKYRIRYGAPQNCGDEIALALTEYVTLPRKNKKNPDGGLDRAKLRAVAEINGIGHKLAVWEDNGLNGGLLRMNTANVLRGMNRRGERVEIGDQVWEAREVPKKVRKGRSKKAAA